MSSNSSMADRSMRVLGSLHLVEHVREGSLELERFLDFVGTHVRILTVFQESSGTDARERT